jgi:hypothetical protein
MNDVNDVINKADATKAKVKEWLSRESPAKVRLVQYSGIEHLGSIDVLAEEVGEQVRGLICEGFSVKWSVDAEVAFLCVWEYPGPEPEWAKVYREMDLSEIPALDNQAKQLKKAL